MKKDKLNPVWAETFEFPIHEEEFENRYYSRWGLLWGIFFCWAHCLITLNDKVCFLRKLFSVCHWSDESVAKWLVLLILDHKVPSLLITKTSLFKYTENFTTKNENFQIKNLDIFHISAQNIDCGYSLELPHQGSSNEYHNLCFLADKKNNVYLCKPQFYHIKVGFKGVNTQHYIGMFSW